jgi:DNA-binding transcriptional LysR family regulator
VDIKHLSSLVAIADNGSFSAAAKALYTVQSNVSAHIARLERELGSVLVDRATGVLTDEGEVVLERARRILREVEDIPGDLSALEDQITGVTRLGVLSTTARWLMPQVLNTMASRFPEVHVTVHEGSTSSLIPRVVEGQIDAAIVHLPLTEPDLTIEPLFAEDLVLLVHTKHQLSGRSNIGIEELATHALLLPPPGTAFRRVLDRLAASKEVSLRAHAEIDGVRLLASLAFEGYGAAIVPSSAIPQWLEGPFSRIEINERPQRTVGWVQRRRPSANSATRAIFNVTVDALSNIRPQHSPGIHRLHSGGTTTGG